MWRSSYIVIDLAIKFDVVCSQIVSIISNGTSPDSVEKIEGLLEKLCVWRLSRLEIWLCNWRIWAGEAWSLWEVRIVCIEFWIRWYRGFGEGQIVQCNVVLVCWQLWQVLGKEWFLLCKVWGTGSSSVSNLILNVLSVEDWKLWAKLETFWLLLR